MRILTMQLEDVVDGTVFRSMARLAVQELHLLNPGSRQTLLNMQFDQLTRELDFQINRQVSIPMENRQPSQINPFNTGGADEIYRMYRQLNERIPDPPFVERDLTNPMHWRCPFCQAEAQGDDTGNWRREGEKWFHWHTGARGEVEAELKT